MHEELIQTLRYQAETIRSMNCTTMSAEQSDAVADALEAQSAQLAANDAEIEYYKALAQDWSTRWFETHDDLARVTEERDAANSELDGICGQNRTRRGRR